MFMESYQELRGEFSITYVLKTLRVLKGITRERMTPLEWDNSFKKFGKMFQSKVESNFGPSSAESDA